MLFGLKWISLEMCSEFISWSCVVGREYWVSYQIVDIIYALTKLGNSWSVSK